MPEQHDGTPETTACRGANQRSPHRGRIAARSSEWQELNTASSTGKVDILTLNYTRVRLLAVTALTIAPGMFTLAGGYGETRSRVVLGPADSAAALQG